VCAGADSSAAVQSSTGPSNLTAFFWDTSNSLLLCRGDDAGVDKMDDEGRELDLDPGRNFVSLNFENENGPDDRADSELGGVVTLVTVVEDPVNPARHWPVLVEERVSLFLATGMGAAAPEGFFIDERAGGGGRTRGSDLAFPLGRAAPRGLRCGVLDRCNPMAICSTVGGAEPARMSSGVKKWGG
jgi:hypothetical protein